MDEFHSTSTCSKRCDRKCFLRCERGSATVEVVLWLPFLLLLISLIADTSLLFNRQAQMIRAVQDMNRAFVVGRLTTPQDVQTALIDLYRPVSRNVTAESELDMNIAGGVIRTTLSVPARDVVSVGLIAAFTNFNLTVSAHQFREF
ncbi:MAG: TadE/TadG family type IV pilus assembly protein [Paracoccaceae bacterium]